MEKPEKRELDQKEPEVKPEIEPKKGEVDWVIKIPARVRSSSSIQKMANDLIERIKMEMARP